MPHLDRTLLTSQKSPGHLPRGISACQTGQGSALTLPTGGRGGEGACPLPLPQRDIISGEQQPKPGVRNWGGHWSARLGRVLRSVSPPHCLPKPPPHLMLHVVPGLLQAALGRSLVVPDDLAHDVTHLLLQLQRGQQGSQSLL